MHYRHNFSLYLLTYLLCYRTVDSTNNTVNFPYQLFSITFKSDIMQIKVDKQNTAVQQINK